MQRSTTASRLPPGGLSAILDVTRALAAPFDLHTLLERITAAAQTLLRAERVSVWLHDAARGELYVEVAPDLPALRLPVGRGLVGACAQQRSAIQVPDCYADPRFNPEVDRQSGLHTRCSLTVPLIDHQSALVGVLQLLNMSAPTEL
jgi:phosphoserine phosphatase RsbU/P